MCAPFWVSWLRSYTINARTEATIQFCRIYCMNSVYAAKLRYKIKVENQCERLRFGESEFCGSENSTKLLYMDG